MNNFEALVSLNLIPQIGSVCLENLLKYFQQPQDIFKAARKDLDAAVGERLGENIASFDTRRLNKDLLLAKKSGIRIITLFCQGYPQALTNIPGKPIVLYVLGNITEQDNLAFGIVGSRRASFYGLNSAAIFASQLSACGITIVSGMARGVDTYAHRGALKVKGRTIAVMGSGFNNIYPEENADLAKEISLSGAVISEFSMETEPLPMNFPRRNRLISGLSRGILVTEAARNSGALITADFALEQGREVFALPGRIDSNNSTGANTLLKQGAKLVTCCDDILEELNLKVSCKKDPDAGQAEQGIISADDEGKLYDCISQEPVAIDDLVEKTTFSPSRISSLILKLQFKKLIKELPGKQFMRN